MDNKEQLYPLTIWTVAMCRLHHVCSTHWPSLVMLWNHAWYKRNKETNTNLSLSLSLSLSDTDKCWSRSFLKTLHGLTQTLTLTTICLNQTLSLTLNTNTKSASSQFWTQLLSRVEKAIPSKLVYWVKIYYPAIVRQTQAHTQLHRPPTNTCNH